jgi:hypothetical protein
VPTDSSPTEVRRNLGRIKRGAGIAGVEPSTVRNWVHQGLIYAVRVGNGPYLVDLDEVAAMRVEYPRDEVDPRIRELVENAPEFSAKQINQIRLLLHAAPAEAAEK